MSTSGQAVLIALVTVSLAFVVAYGFFKLMAPRRTPASALDFARKWAAWVAALVTVTMLPRFFREIVFSREPDTAEPFVRWLAVLVLAVTLAFVTGWLYGKLFGLKRNDNSPRSRATGAKDDAGTEHVFCAQCGSRLEMNARFCSKCGHAVSAERKGDTKDAAPLPDPPKEPPPQVSPPPARTSYSLILVTAGLYQCPSCKRFYETSKAEWDRLNLYKQCISCGIGISLP